MTVDTEKYVEFVKEVTSEPSLDYGAMGSRLAELEVTGTGNVYIRVTASTDNDSAALELTNTQETWTMVNDDTNSDALEFQCDGGTKMTVQTDGSVGIGTTRADQSLSSCASLYASNGLIPFRM